MFVCVVASLSSSCKVLYPNVLFRTHPEDITIDSVVTTEKQEYLITTGDKLSFQIFSNKGYRLVDFGLRADPRAQNSYQGQLVYLVQDNGFLRLPIVDSVYIKGYSTKQAERMLEDIYSKYINDPLIFLKVINRRVYLFKGNSDAQVITIENENTSLIEILAQSGGIPEETKAYKVKIIRGSLNDPIIREIDLSTIESIKKSDLNIQANDIIYVEPVTRVTTGILKEISPVISLITSTLFLITILNRQSP